MALYTTLFAATDDELTQFLPGWRMPLEKAIQKTVPMKFGPRREVVITTWDGGCVLPDTERGSLNDTHRRLILPPVLPPNG